MDPKLTHYVPQDQLPVVLSPDASTSLLETLLKRSGGAVIYGVTVVEFENAQVPDIAIFHDGTVRELGNELGAAETARAIVAAAKGVARGIVSAAQPEPLPEGRSFGGEHAPEGGPWVAYEVDGGWMAWSPLSKRFDRVHTYPSEEACVPRVDFLNKFAKEL